MPTRFDLAFAIAFAVVIPFIDYFVFDKPFKAAVAAGVPDARRHGYRRIMIMQWVLASVVVFIWATTGRSWHALQLTPVLSLRPLIGIGIILAAAVLAMQQTRAIGRITSQRREQLRPKLERVEFILPHTYEEYRWFTALSCTAGFCEELLYRGYLMWVLSAYFSTVAAIVITVVVFGAAHIYQGPRGAVKAGSAALVMSLVVLTTGWLLPTMVLHALTDAMGGTLGVHVYAKPTTRCRRAAL